MTQSPLVLVVDDSPTQQLQIQLILEEHGYRVLLAADGAEALQVMGQELPDLVVTDLQMPNMDGLELVTQIKMQHNSVPVILATAMGSESIAAAALHEGASSYVPKNNLTTSLVPIVRQVLSHTQQAMAQREVAKYVQQMQLKLRIGNDESLVPSIIGRLEQIACELDFCDEMLWMQIAMALDEALINAIFHGNLAVSSELRQVDDGKPFFDLIHQRKQQEPYKDRFVDIEMTISHEQVSFTITDQGKGFDVSSIPDPTDPANLEKAGGRGLLLIYSFMDSVKHNAAGNQITMIKNRPTMQEFDEEFEQE